jgi:ABC-type multidrug transport system ATPase subunit
MIAGLIEPTRGHITYRDRDIREWLVDYKRLVGYVPEEAHLYTYLTAPNISPSSAASEAWLKSDRRADRTLSDALRPLARPVFGDVSLVEGDARRR